MFSVLQYLHRVLLTESEHTAARCLLIEGMETGGTPRREAPPDSPELFLFLNQSLNEGLVMSDMSGHASVVTPGQPIASDQVLEGQPPSPSAQPISELSPHISHAEIMTSDRPQEGARERVLSRNDRQDGSRNLLQPYVIMDRGQCGTAFLAARHLREGTGQVVDIALSFPASGKIVLVPQTRHAAGLLHDFARDRPKGIEIGLITDERKTKGVLLGFPHSIPLESLTAHPSVVSAKRCVVRRPREEAQETRNVEVVFYGP